MLTQKYIHQWYRIKSCEIKSHTYSQSMTKEARIYNGKKTISSISDPGKIGQLHVKKKYIRTFSWESPGCPVFRTPCFFCQGPRLLRPWLGNYHKSCHSQKKKKKKRTFSYNIYKNKTQKSFIP